MAGAIHPTALRRSCVATSRSMLECSGRPQVEILVTRAEIDERVGVIIEPGRRTPAPTLAPSTARSWNLSPIDASFSVGIHRSREKVGTGVRHTTYDLAGRRTNRPTKLSLVFDKLTALVSAHDGAK